MKLLFIKIKISSTRPVKIALSQIPTQAWCVRTRTLSDTDISICASLVCTIDTTDVNFSVFWVKFGSLSSLCGVYILTGLFYWQILVSPMAFYSSQKDNNSNQFNVYSFLKQKWKNLNILKTIIIKKSLFSARSIRGSDVSLSFGLSVK